MKKGFILLLLVCLNFFVAAQNALHVGNKRSTSDDKMIVQLKFMFPGAVISNYTINVYRKQLPAGNWEKINSVTIQKTPLGKPNSGSTANNTYQGFLSRKQPNNARGEGNAKMIAGLMLLADNEFAKHAGCYYEDMNVIIGGTYQYRITDALAGDKELAVSLPFTVRENYLPVINDLDVTQRGQTILLNWSVDKVFYAYRVYAKSGPGSKATLLTHKPIMIGTVKGDKVQDNLAQYKFTDTATLSGITRYYTVTGIDVLGNESAMAPDVKITITDMQPPAAIQGLKGIKKDKTIALAWLLSKEKDVVGYTVFRNNSTDTAYRKISGILPSTVATYTDNGLFEGAVYGYRIETVDAAGNAARSRPVKVFFPDQTAPAKPTGLKGISQPGVISLTWNKNVEADIQGYYVFRASTSNKEYFNLLNREPFAANSFTDTLPGVAKNKFVYYIQAVDKEFNKSEFSDTAIIFLPDTMAPHAPHLKTIALENDSAILNWERPPDKDVAGYWVYKTYDSIPDSYQKINTKPVSELRLSDKISSPHTVYYMVKSIDNAGNISIASNIQMMVIEPDNAATPATNIRIAFKPADTAVHIEWQQQSRNVRGYAIYRKEDENANFVAVSEVISANNYIDKDIEPNKQYYYMIRSFFYNDSFENSVIVKSQSK